MRLKEINDAIAAACNVRASVVTAVQNETFRRIRAALDRGEKVVLPDFGSFVVKEAPATEPGGAPKRTVRFREQRADAGKGEGGGGAKADRKNHDKPGRKGADDGDED